MAPSRNVKLLVTSHSCSENTSGTSSTATTLSNQGATGAGASGVSVSASSSTGATGAETDVERYMAATYGIQLRHPDWPCVAVGAVAHIPPELCR